MLRAQDDCVTVDLPEPVHPNTPTTRIGAAESMVPSAPKARLEHACAWQPTARRCRKEKGENNTAAPARRPGTERPTRREGPKAAQHTQRFRSSQSTHSRIKCRAALWLSPVVSRSCRSFSRFVFLVFFIWSNYRALAVLDEKKLLKVIRRSLPHCSKLGKSQKVRV